MKLIQLNLIALFVFTHSLYAQYENTVKVGEKAPPLSIQEWVKGEPVTEFKPAQLYVVEFSATWCGPCRKAIPHLSELTRQYKGTVNFISVYIENNNLQNLSDLSYIGKVKYLMDALGDKVAFSVAVDVPQQSTRKAWGINGIPASFVVNNSGIIEWVGHPLKLDNVLKELTESQFDSAKATQNEIAFKERVGKILEAKNNGDYIYALMGIDSLINTNPQVKWLYPIKFNICAGDDDRKAYEFLQSLLDNKTQGIDWMYLISDGFPKISPVNRNYEIEFRTIDRAIEESETTALAAYPWYQKAEKYASLGDFVKALECVEKSLKYSEEFRSNQDDTWIYERGLYEKAFVSYRYQLLLKEDLNKAKVWMKTEVASRGIIVDESLLSPILDVPDNALALELVSAAIDKEQNVRRRGNLLGIKSNVYSRMGDIKKAIDYCQLSVEEYKKEGGSNRLAKDQEAKLAQLRKETDRN